MFQDLHVGELDGMAAASSLVDLALCVHTKKISMKGREISCLGMKGREISCLGVDRKKGIRDYGLPPPPLPPPSPENPPPPPPLPLNQHKLKCIKRTTEIINICS